MIGLVHKAAALAIVPLAAFPAAEGDATRALEILQTKCFECHSKVLSMSGLDLSSREAALRGGSRGASIEAGHASGSRLIAAVERKGKLAMPPASPLTAAEVDVLRRWIDHGADWPAAPPSSTQRSNYWSFQKVIRPIVPKSGDVWIRNDVDEFVLAKLRAGGLAPSSQAAAANEVASA